MRPHGEAAHGKGQQSRKDIVNRSWKDCVERLLTRGLLICGKGETEYDALYDLLSSMYIIPTRPTAV